MTFPVVRVVSGEPRGGPGRIGVPSKMSGTCWWTLGVVRDR